MRRTYNRQQRRAGKCLRAPSAGARRPGVSARLLALAADGEELVRLAARLAAEIELAPEVIAELSPGFGRH